MNISVIGTGYVGLVTATCLASIGHNVVCVDTDEDKVTSINKGISPIHEDYLQDKLKLALDDNMLIAQTDLLSAVISTDVSFIAVGTPFNGSKIDLRFIEQVSEEIGRALRHKDKYHLIVIKSTVVPGTTDSLVKDILEMSSSKSEGTGFGIAMNPEFLREGSAVDDFINPDRIVLGANNDKAHSILNEIYAPYSVDIKMFVTCKTAEMMKYAANAFFASLISFSNEIANLCSSAGDINTTDVFKGLALDKRLSPIVKCNQRIQPDFISYLKPGCGFGGSCFPKDVKALISYGEELGQSMPLLCSVVSINKFQPSQMIKLMRKHFDDFSNVKVGILGLAFKPNTDDIRESPAISLANELFNLNCTVFGYDPVVSIETFAIAAGFSVRSSLSLDSMINSVDCLMLVTAWDVFQSLPKKLIAMESPPLLIDGRCLFTRSSIPLYETIGY